MEGFLSYSEVMLMEGCYIWNQGWHLRFGANGRKVLSLTDMERAGLGKVKSSALCHIRSSVSMSHVKSADGSTAWECQLRDLS
jgi:hypothetical protein